MSQLDQLREAEPRFDHLKAIDKIALEDRLGLRGSRYRSLGQKIGVCVFGLSAPFAVEPLIDSLHKVPTLAQYMTSVPLGMTIGLALGYAVGTMAYEVTARDGEIGHFFYRRNNSA